MTRHDSRVKIQKNQYEIIRDKVGSIMEEYGTSQNFAIKKVASEFDVNPKTIYWIINPEQKEKDREKTRKYLANKYKKVSKTKEYKEQRAMIMRKHRLRKKHFKI